MKKRIVSALLSLLMCLSMPCMSAAALDLYNADTPSTAVSTAQSPLVKGVTNPDLTLDEVEEMDITECIAIANSITPPENHGVGTASVEISPAEEAAIQRVLEYDRQRNEGVAVYSKAASYDFTSEYYYNQLTSNEKKTYNEMLSVFNNCVNSTASYSTDKIGYVTNYGSRSQEEIDHVYQMFYYSNPQIFCTYLRYGWTSDYSRIYLYINEECMSGTTRSKVKSSIDSTTSSWLSKMSSIDGYVAKEKWLAEKVVSKVTYTFVDDLDQTIMGALYYGKCVCNGYAMTMNYFLNAAGIECITVVSSDHAWNRVKLYNKWYELDVTWMDYDDAANTCDYRWFNKSTATFMTNDPKRHHDPQTDVEAGSYFYANISIPSCVNNDPSDPVFDEVNAAAFVERLYVKLLGRASDANGKADHVNDLRSGKAACEVIKKFVFSRELKNKNLSNTEFVTRMYRAMFNREPDTKGLASYTTALDNGCSYGYVFQKMSSSSEFAKLCTSYGITKGTYKSSENRDQNPNLTAYVARMYTVALGRQYDVTGLNTHTGNYLSGRRTAKDIARSFLFCTEFKNKNKNITNAQFLDYLYRTLFDREADANGKSYWLAKMNNGMTREEVFNNFTSSKEFRNMVAAFGI